MLQARLPLLPPDARVVSPDLAVLLDDDRLAVFNASGTIYTCDRDDQEGLRLAAAMFTKLGLAKPTALARALEMHPATVFHYRQLLKGGGGARRRLDQGWPIRRAADEAGLAEGTLRHAMKRGQLRPRADVVPESAPAPVEELSPPADGGEDDKGG